MSVLGGVSGIASGLDTDAIVAQLMAVERQPEVRMQQRQKRAEARQGLLNDIASRLRTLRSAAADLRSAALWTPKQPVTSSDTTKVGVVRTGTPAPGTHTVTVANVATAEQRSYVYTAVKQASTLTINGVALALSGNETIDGVASAINARADVPAGASVVNGQLLLTAKATGTALTVASSRAATFTEDGTRQSLARQASYTVDGQARSSASNTVTDIAGLSLNLLGATTTPATITVEAPSTDTDAVKAKVKAFVEAYNGTIAFVQGKLTERRPANPQTQAEFNKGLVQGDTALTGLLSRLRTALTGAVAGNPATSNELADVGIAPPAASASGGLSRDAIEGRLLLDETKLAERLTADPQAVRALFGGVAGQPGFAQGFEAAIDSVAAAGGALDLRAQQAGEQAQRYARSITALEQRLSLREQRLRATFTAMEQALQASQSQMARLQSQLGARA